MQNGNAPILSVVTNTDGIFRWEHAWFQWLLSDFDFEIIVDPEFKVVRERMILAAADDLTGKGPRISSYIQACKSQGARVGVIHLSDEWCASPVDFYKDAAFVFRNHWRKEVIDGSHCRYLPLGYGNGKQASTLHPPKPIGERRNTWCFAGEEKHTRVRMLKEARLVPGGKTHLTSKWEDPAGLGPEQYAELLSDSVFALCPSGNFSPETFRFYEALEAGAIPIVEDWGGVNLWNEVLSPQALFKLRPWQKGRRGACWQKLRTPSYWKTCYGSEFPCPRICFWENVEHTLKNVPVAETSAKVRAWWQGCKDLYRKQLAEAIESTLDLTPKGAAPMTAVASPG